MIHFIKCLFNISEDFISLSFRIIKPNKYFKRLRNFFKLNIRHGHFVVFHIGSNLLHNIFIGLFTNFEKSFNGYRPKK